MSRLDLGQDPAGAPRDQSRQFLFDQLDRRAFQIAELKQQNEALKKQLAAASDAKNGQVTARQLDHPSGGVLEHSDGDNGSLQQKYDDLLKRFSDLQKTHQGCDAAIQRALRKYDASKKVIKAWKEYIDKQPTARKDALQVIAAPRTNGTLASRDCDTTPRPTPRSSLRMHMIANMPQLDERNPSELPSRPSFRTSGSRDRHSPARSSSQTKRITSSQTTDDAHSMTEDLAADMGQGLDNESEVEVVREVNLKRKRSNSAAIMPPPRRIKDEPVSQERPGSAQRPLELRSDDFSSPVARRRMALRTETSDLDAMIAGGALLAPMQEHQGTARAKSEGPHKTRRIVRRNSSLSDGGLDEVEQQTDLAHASLDVREAAVQRHHRVTGNDRPQQSAGRKANALRQLSPNMQSSPSKKRVRSREAEGDADKVAFVSEDGDERTSQVALDTRPTDHNTTKAVASRRLDALLEKPTPAKQALQKKQSPEPWTLPRPTKASKPHRDHQRGMKPTTPASHGSVRIMKSEKPMRSLGSPPPVLPEDEPLRLRPCNALRVEDFRPNPKHTGSEFAIADTIRGREARKCLPGCIRPECCGHFLEMARMGVLPATDKSDDDVLEDFLGSDFRKILASYPAVKRRETLLKARAQEVANISGKHRQAFERAKSPPGYWRTDMPSTQEEAEYRRKAWEMEREKVEERWREATRTDGRWLFRDE